MGSPLKVVFCNNGFSVNNGLTIRWNIPESRGMYQALPFRSRILSNVCTVMKSLMRCLWTNGPTVPRLLAVSCVQDLTSLKMTLGLPLSETVPSLSLTRLLFPGTQYVSSSRLPSSAEKGFPLALQSDSGTTGSPFCAWASRWYSKYGYKHGTWKIPSVFHLPGCSRGQSCQLLSQRPRLNGNTCTVSATPLLSTPDWVALSNQLGTFVQVFNAALGI